MGEQSTVRTPDFYDYAWTPLATAAVDGRFVELAWPDGHTMRAFDLWLRETAVGPGGTDEATREGTLDPAQFPSGLTVSEASVTAEGALQVRFMPEDITREFHPGWLRHVADDTFRPHSWLPETVRWSAADLEHPPTHEGPSVLADDDALTDYLNDLMTYGLARLRNLPVDLDMGEAIAARVGPLRDNNFGRMWDVRANIPLNGASDTNSTANTNRRLAPHTDLPTRETPPGFQFLHCVANSTTGGLSTMADGWTVIDHLEAHHPEVYEILCTRRWVFFNRGQGLDHRWSGPIIDRGVIGSPLTLRAFYPVKGFPDMAEEHMPAAYDALNLFYRLAAQPEFELRYPFEPGDMIGFDNRRILHGRSAYLEGGERHLRGFYIDQDEVRSRTRVLNRARGHSAPRAFTQTTISTNPTNSTTTKESPAHA